MQQRNEMYLLVLSVLLGISVLKLTEVFQLADQLQDVLLALKTAGLTAPVLAVYLFVAGYIVFFSLTALAGYGIVNQFRGATPPTHDLGPLIAGCVVALTVSYLLVYSIAMNSILGQLGSVHFH